MLSTNKNIISVLKMTEMKSSIVNLCIHDQYVV